MLNKTGFKIIPFGNADALQNSISENTVAFLVEPIQGEGGIIVPPDGYLKKVKAICRKHKILLVLDEIQTGLGRTGYDFAYMHEGNAAKPDILILGKALGGGLLPVSAVVTKSSIMKVIKPADHGSTFGGNPLGCSVAIEAINVLRAKRLSQRVKHLGKYFTYELKKIKRTYIKAVRGRGLLIGVELTPEAGGARRFCEALLEEGILCGEAHKNVIRFTPPLIISKDEINEAVAAIKEAINTI